MEIERDHYLNQIKRKKHNGQIKVITGIRRCGKSYFLNTIFYNALLKDGIQPNQIVRFAFDSADDLIKIGENPAVLDQKDGRVDPVKFIKWMNAQIGDGEYYLLLDEIQLLGSFESVLNGYLRNEKLDIYVTGSNAKLLSRDVATEFASRGDEVEMRPLSFLEFMSVCTKDRYQGLAEYMMYGGIPLVVLREDPSDKSSLLKNLYDEIYIKDILRRNNIRNQDDLEDLINCLSSSIGSLTNPDILQRTFHSRKKSKITSATIKKYILALEDSFLIESSNRYNVKGKQYISTPKKYYFSDLGLRNVRLNFRQYEPTHAMENTIYNELRLRGYNVDVGVVPIYEIKDGKQERKQLEVDFICSMAEKKYYVQSAYSIPDEEKINQEIRPFKRISDSFKKIVVTGDIIPAHYDDNGYLWINIYDFLLNPSSMDL